LCFGRHGAPSSQRWRLSIQLPYSNNFKTVWECSDAVADGLVDWRSVLVQGCPLCGRHDCWRVLTPYERKVIELMPYREGVVLVARFLCRTTGKTFSLLPFWLAPYHLYTSASMVLALLLAVATRPDGIKSLFAAAEQKLEGDCRANGFLLGCWLVLCVTGLHRAHTELARWANFDGLKPGRDVYGQLDELVDYCQALEIRDPPLLDGPRGLDEVLERHARTTGRFLFGTPSQDRGGRVAP